MDTHETNMDHVIRDLRYLKSYGRVNNNQTICEIAESALELLKEQQRNIEYWSAKYDEMGKQYMAVRDERDELLKEQRTGRWEDGHCTYCGEDFASCLDTWTDVLKFAYCPNCGAAMEGGEQE